jgi:hypothetical protein
MSGPEGVFRRCTHKIVLTYADLIARTSGTAFTIYPGLNSALNLPKGFVVRAVYSDIVTAAVSSGGAITSLSLSIGDTASATKYVNATDCKTVDTFTVYQTGFAHTNATDNIKAVATIVGQTLASLTALEVHIWFDMIDLNTGENP